MKKLKGFFTILLMVMAINLNAQETITNESVLQMVELGFSDDIIITKINASDYEFDTSLSELAKLKKGGVSSEVIALLIEKSKYKTKSKIGIYYTDAKGDSKLIQPTVFSGNSTNSAAQKLVSGLINAKQKATLPKARSNNVMSTSAPEFTFIFDPSTAEVDNLQPQQGGGDLFNWWFKTASSPNEFVLVKLRVKAKKNLREIITGKSSSISSSSGVDPKNALPFSIEEIDGAKYKVIPENLAPGEYAFFYQGQIPGGRSNQAVFDFSVQ